MNGFAANNVKQVTADTVAGMVDNPTTTIVDVREPYETARGVIPGARKIPLGQLARRIAEIPTGQTVIAVCAHGHRSVNAARLLMAAGFDAASMAGGMVAWQSAGLPVEP
jgi:rhodanese-related sulfurtransferase